MDAQQTRLGTAAGMAGPCGAGFVLLSRRRGTGFTVSPAHPPDTCLSNERASEGKGPQLLGVVPPYGAVTAQVPPAARYAPPAGMVPVPAPWKLVVRKTARNPCGGLSKV